MLSKNCFASKSFTGCHTYEGKKFPHLVVATVAQYVIRQDKWIKSRWKRKKQAFTLSLKLLSEPKSSYLTSL